MTLVRPTDDMSIFWKRINNGLIKNGRKVKLDTEGCKKWSNANNYVNQLLIENNWQIGDLIIKENIWDQLIKLFGNLIVKNKNLQQHVNKLTLSCQILYILSCSQ